MKKIAVIGKYFGGRPVSDGQSVKTKILTDEFVRVFGDDQITRLDTIGWKKHPFRLFFGSILAVWTCRNVMFMTDEKGTKIFPRLLRLANFAGRCRLHYYVIGGWLSGWLDRSESACRILKKLDAIYVEVPAMLRELEERGFRNAVLVNKFRRLNPTDAGSLALEHEPPYKLCFFSRVMKEKGIEEAIAAVKKANSDAGYTRYTLDIFGAIHAEYRETFEKMTKEFPDYIRYGGIVDCQNSSAVLKNYFALLFPTFYTSEGYPNAVVDAFAAGLPIIATRWNYNGDIIRNGEDGILVEPRNIGQLTDAMEYLAENRDVYARMRHNCLARCTEYRPEYAVEKVMEHMN